MSRILSFDAAWGGIGWAICGEDGVDRAGHFRPKATRRERNLLAWLEETIATEITLSPVDGVVIERIPWNYARGNQARTIYGLSGCQHIIMAWALMRPEFTLYPDLVPPAGDGAWRPWWGISGPRLRCKRMAVDIAKRLGYASMLAPFPDLDSNGDGARGDIAEAILIGLGVARGMGSQQSAQLALPAKRKRAAPRYVASRGRAA